MAFDLFRLLCIISFIKAHFPIVQSLAQSSRFSVFSSAVWVIRADQEQRRFIGGIKL